jgi:hypothetical protein
MDEPLEHVARPLLPWQDRSTLTECGLDTVGRTVLSREEFRCKFKEQGRKRAGLSTCMTCLETASCHPSWDEDPVRSLWRETYGRPRPGFRDELLAIAELVDRHYEEFTTILAGLAETVRLDDRRRATRRRWT